MRVKVGVAALRCDRRVHRCCQSTTVVARRFPVVGDLGCGWWRAGRRSPVGTVPSARLERLRIPRVEPRPLAGEQRRVDDLAEESMAEDVARVRTVGRRDEDPRDRPPRAAPPGRPAAPGPRPPPVTHRRSGCPRRRRPGGPPDRPRKRPRPAPAGCRAGAPGARPRSVSRDAARICSAKNGLPPDRSIVRSTRSGSGARPSSSVISAARSARSKRARSTRSTRSPRSSSAR